MTSSLVLHRQQFSWTKVKPMISMRSSLVIPGFSVTRLINLALLVMVRTLMSEFFRRPPVVIGQNCPVMGEGGNAVALHVAPLQHLLQH